MDRIKILVFIWSGFCIGLAGIMGAARLGIGQVTIGRGSLFPAITAVVALGGTSLSGGKGSVLGTVLGVALVTVIQNGMNVIGVDAFWQQIVFGFIVILAVSMTVDRRGRSLIMK